MWSSAVADELELEAPAWNGAVEEELGEKEDDAISFLSLSEAEAQAEEIWQDGMVRLLHLKFGRVVKNRTLCGAIPAWNDSKIM